MDRRGFMLGAGAILAAGCARVAPTGVGRPAGSTSAAAALPIGHDGTTTGAVLAHLLAQAIIAKGGVAAVTVAGADWHAALADGSLAALPTYAETVLAALSPGAEPPAPDGMITVVASLVAPEVDTLSWAKVDGGLVWLVSAETAGAGITSLDRVASWSKGKLLALPKLAVSRADGLPGLKAIYRAAFTLRELDDPKARAAALRNGTAAVAAFRRSEYTGASGLVALEDPDKLGVADPLVIMLNPALADAEPQFVLAMDAVAKLLTTDGLLELQQRTTSGVQVPAVARNWLVANGIA